MLFKSYFNIIPIHIVFEHLKCTCYLPNNALMCRSTTETFSYAYILLFTSTNMNTQTFTLVTKKETTSSCFICFLELFCHKYVWASSYLYSSKE